MSEEVQSPINQAQQLLESWQYLSADDRASTFRSLKQDDAEEIFQALDARTRVQLFEGFSPAQRRLWIRFMPPDDAVDVIQQSPDELKMELLGLVDENTRREIVSLMSYLEDEAGGLMSPRFVRTRPDMLVAEALRYVQKQAQLQEHVHYVYVLDMNQKLLGVLSLRELFIAPPDKRVSEIMRTEPVKVAADLDQEAVSRIFKQHRFYALPVVDDADRMQGVVTVDDILDVSQEEATEDIQKLGGTEALDAPYPQVNLRQMIKKRAGWLTILFVGEMFTATAMGQFEHEIAKAVVLALFIPLIISSGGNSGSQATTLIIRAMALGELRLRDWWRVLWRECITGVALGGILALIGFLRIALWPGHRSLYTEHWQLVSAVVSLSLIGVVLFGTIVGSMLPFILRRFNFDPASASAPLVATVVDVTGLVIYFELARFILAGTLL